MSAQQSVQRPQLVWSKQIGIELEGWYAKQTSSVGLPSVDDGYFTDDAGYHLSELIASCCRSTASAVEVLRRLHDQEPSIRFTPFRPPDLMSTSGVWHDKPRYKVVREALAIEAPQYVHLVNEMTDRAALHVNLSGDFAAEGDEGAFIVSIMNEIALFIAAEVHHEIGFGKGHLSIWRYFARPERLPQLDRWFESGEEMRRYIEETPRLIKEVTKDSYLPLPLGETNSIYEPLDLGVTWWFVRLKKGTDGWYLEFRFLPSMPLSLAQQYVDLVVHMTEELLDWFHGANRGQAVSSRDMAWDALFRLRQAFPSYVPNRPMTRESWNSLFNL